MLGGEERLEEARELVRRDTVAGVTHDHVNLLASRFDTHGDPAAIQRGVIHGVYSVEQKIQQHLLQLNAIAKHGRQR